jgi:hypothetical protein
LFHSLFDDVWEITTSTVFHEDIENSSVTVDVSVMVADNMVVVQVFENIPGRKSVAWRLKEYS